MQYQGTTLCDFCFSRIEAEGVCPRCGLTHQNYTLETGILPPGTLLDNKYVIGRLLGRGGFGATYLAFSLELGCVVAIKEYFPMGISTRGSGETIVTVVSKDKQEVYQKGAAKMYEEAQTVFKFNSCKNIVSVIEFFYANATVYFAMEYLVGVDLKTYVSKKGGRISEQEVIKIIQGMCSALMMVHSENTLHRDIKPDNIMLCTDGGVKLFDFGSAKQVVEEESRNYSVVVTRGFAPAEQYSAKGNQGPWTDIYAVGATMYYALTGQLPPDAMTRYDSPELTFDPRLGISPVMISIIDKCMKFRAEERYQNAEQLLADINLHAQNLGISDVEFDQVDDDDSDNVNSMDDGLGDVDVGEEMINFDTLHSGLVSTNRTEYRMQLVAERKAAESNGFFKGLLLGLAMSVVILAAMIAVVLITGGGDDGGPVNEPAPFNDVDVDMGNLK